MVGIKPPSPQQIWRFSSAHLRKVISKTKWSVIQYMKEILEVLDHRERAESIVSWSGLHLKYNAIFFYARAGESASCQFFAASSERSATFFTPRVQWKLWKVHLNYPIDTCRSRHMSTKGEFVEILEFTHFSRVFKFNKTSEIGRKKEIFNEIKVSVVMELVWVDTKMCRS